jgi:tyrosine-specific transport protein
MFNFLISKLTRSKTVGATFIIAGTMIGSGMLAMPLESLSIGLSNSLLLLGFMAFLMLGAAFIQADLLKYQRPGVSFATLVGANFGEKYKIIPAIIKCLLFYSLLACYMTGASSIIKTAFDGFMGTDSSLFLITTLFASIFGIIISVPLNAMDRLNRFFVILMFIIFGIILWLLNPSLTPTEALLLPKESTFLEMLKTVPIFFTAFGFHGSIPTLVEYLKQDQKKIFISFTVGMLITVSVYFLWQYSIMSILEQKNIFVEGGNLNDFLTAISTQTTTPATSKNFLDLFYFLVIITSFIGVGIGQFNYIFEISHNIMAKKTEFSKRFFAGILTIFIPFIFAVSYPSGFIMALKFAGIWLCFLALILPALMGVLSPKTSIFIKALSVFCLASGLLLLIVEALLQLQ